MPKAPKATEEVAADEAAVATDEVAAAVEPEAIAPAAEEADSAPLGTGCSPEYLRWQS